MITTRRSFVFGAAATLIAAPAIVRASSLMHLRSSKMHSDLPFDDLQWNLVPRNSGVHPTYAELDDFRKRWTVLEDDAGNKISVFMASGQSRRQTRVTPYFGAR